MGMEVIHRKQSRSGITVMMGCQAIHRRFDEELQEPHVAILAALSLRAVVVPA